MIDGIAHIICQCGAVFQVVREDGKDWDEAATAAEYDAHSCK